MLTENANQLFGLRNLPAPQSPPVFMFKVKICGITNLEDAKAVIQSGADAIGLNFFEKSPRYISPFDANFLCLDLPKSFARVGLFVNATKEDIDSTVEHLALDYIQLHGDESPDFAASLYPHRVIRAIRLPQAENTEQLLVDLTQEVESFSSVCKNLSAILLDAHDPNIQGGTGKCLDWDLVRKWTNENHSVPIILAGGLNRENVGQAIETTGLKSVDVASGVEDIPGIKSQRLVQDFVANALKAIKELD